MKVFIASFNRASDGALETLRKKMESECMASDDYVTADWILAVGDRSETFDFVIERFRENRPIAHLWAGEVSQGTHDEVYRHAMTLISKVQFCTNERAKERVELLCHSVDKQPDAHVVGNVMLDDLSADESLVPSEPYNLILYNPPTSESVEDIERELTEIKGIIRNDKKRYIWIAPNGDPGSDLIFPHVNTDNLPRKQFLGLLKNCHLYITNSSSQYYEAPFLMNKDQIVSIGQRNTSRESGRTDMTLRGAAEKIISLFKSMSE